MFELIRKKFIKNCDDKDDPIVREKYGIVFSVVSIIFNFVLVVFKLLISTITNSVSIRSDALNNLSDVGSNVATLIGFKIAGKHADADHPYGHGRFEYLSGLIVAALIMYMGISALFEAIDKIIHPVDISFNYLAMLVLLASIIVKLMMAGINSKAGNFIDSDTLNAAGQDSRNDAMVTGATLVSLLVYRIFDFNIDPYVGAAVSVLVLISGFEIIKDVLDNLLGKAPDEDYVKELEDFVLSNKEILGIHDFMLHDYGPNNSFLTFHAEVNGKEDIMTIHDVIDNIENEIYQKYKLITTIHIDPLTVDDPDLNKNHDLIINIIKKINEKYSIHDLRMVKGPSHTNLVFDLLLPSGDKIDHSELKEKVVSEVKKINPSLNCVMKIEHDYVTRA